MPPAMASRQFVYKGAIGSGTQSAPKELDLNGYESNVGLCHEESCIVGGDVSGIAQRSRKPLECGSFALILIHKLDRVSEALKARNSRAQGGDARGACDETLG
jgi:hypothetical protein